MARFRLKPVEVEAEPYRPGLEDAFSTGAVPVLVTPAGRVELAPGDWIVTRTTGEREVVRAPAFAALYEPCAADGGVRAYGPALRGIPLRSG